MDQFSAADLQKVILRYDQVHRENREKIQDQNNLIENMQVEMDQLKAALVKQSDRDEELDMYKEEASRLKLIINELTKQNEDLSK